MCPVGKYCVLLLGVVPLASPATAQTDFPSYRFLVWQIEPDESHALLGKLGGGGSSNMDFRIWIKPRRWHPNPPEVRLDADFAVHRMVDSTLMVADVIAGTVVARAVHEARNVGLGEYESHATVEEAAYRRSIVLAHTDGESAWFYPFGVPRAGERGIAFEISYEDPEEMEGDTRDTLPKRFQTPSGALADTVLLPGGFGIEVRGRLHRARLRVEVGEPTENNVGRMTADTLRWRQAFEGELLTRVPVQIHIGEREGRAQDLELELEAPDWQLPGVGTVCLRWRWRDDEVLYRVLCGIRQGERTVGTVSEPRGLVMRVTVLSRSDW